MFRPTMAGAACFFVLVAAWAQESIAPPRSISDITALIDQYKPDAARAEALRAIVSGQPPAEASRSQLIEFLHKRASAAAEAGAFGQALEDQRRVVELARGEVLEARHLLDLSSLESVAGNLKSGNDLRERSMKLANIGGGQELSNYAYFARNSAMLGDLEKARANLAHAEAMLLRIGNNPRAAPFRTNWGAQIEWTRGVVLMNQGRHAEAEPTLRKAVSLAEQAAAVAESNARNYPGAPHAAATFRLQDLIEGAYTRSLIALGRLSEAELAVRATLRRDLSQSGKYSPQTGLAAANFAFVLIAQGRYREAEMMAQRALEIMDNSGVLPHSMYAVHARRASIGALFGSEKWAEAAAQLQQIRAAVARDDFMNRRLRGNAESGIVFVKGGHPEIAIRLLEPLLAERIQNLGAAHYDTGEIRGVLAMALAARGERARALKEFGEAVSVLLTRGRGGHDTANQGSQRQKLRYILEAYIQLLSEIRGSGLERGAGFDVASESFRLADAARGGSVQQSLAESAARAAANQPGLGELIRKEQDLKQEVTALYDFLLRMMSTPPEEQLPRVMADMRARIVQIDKERVQLFAEIEKRFPDYANLISPRAATLDEAKRALRPGEALVSVLSTSDRSFVWAVSAAGQVSFHSADLGEAQIAKIVASLRRSLDPGDVPIQRMPAFDLDGGYRLYAALLEPASGVWGGAQTLVASVGGALGQIPLAILPTQGDAPARDPAVLFGEMKQVPWLARRAALVAVPSVTAFARLRALPAGNPQRSPFAGFGDPQFNRAATQLASAGATRGVRLRNLTISRVSEPDSGTAPAAVQAAPAAPAAAVSSANASGGSASGADWTHYSDLTPLPDTREEILAIAQALGADRRNDVFLGADASRRRVRETDLSRRRIVAFATHGLIPGDLPGLIQPALALSAPEDRKESPLLTLDDVLSLKLDADWVVLSACNTAAGDGQGAEAVSGLGRGFFYAGSRALLVTHWPVETVSARLLTTGLFERYAKEPNVSRAQALNRSMLALLSEVRMGPDGKAEFSYAHPLFWAPYALIGDGGR